MSVTTTTRMDKESRKRTTSGTTTTTVSSAASLLKGTRLFSFSVTLLSLSALVVLNLDFKNFDTFDFSPTADFSLVIIKTETDVEMMLQTPLRPNSKLKMEEYFLHWVHEANNRIAVRLRFSLLCLWSPFGSFLKIISSDRDDSSRFLRLIFFKNALNISTTSHISSLLLLCFFL